MFKKLFRNSEKGFTLIELLITIAILGVVSAAAIPVISNFQKNAKVAAANIEVSSVKTAAMSYSIGHPDAASVTSTQLVTSGDLQKATSVAYTIGLPDGDITVPVDGAALAGTDATWDSANQAWK